MIIDDLPTGSFLIFCLNVFISFFFQFIGFLLTYLLHTSHAAKYGSRAGLGLTLIQYGFYSRSMNTVVGDPQSPSNGTSIERSETGWVSNGSPTAPMPYTHNQNRISPASRDWLSFLFMTLGKAISRNITLFLHTDFCRLSGWFLLLTSIIGFWRVKRWEQSVRPTPVLAVEQVEEDRHVRQNLEHVFGISFAEPREDNQSRVHQEGSTTPLAPVQSAAVHARLTRDLRAAGLL